MFSLIFVKVFINQLVTREKIGGNLAEDQKFL